MTSSFIIPFQARYCTIFLFPISSSGGLSMRSSGCFLLFIKDNNDGASFR
tara:strand:- start:198 stop:347 length:150 start_codon:yes stop_codon:yes gene_type:complete